MTPAERAKIICEKAGGNFRDELELHLLNGFVFSTPDSFLMGRPVPLSANVENLHVAWPRELCQGWFVWVGVGCPWKLIELMPYSLPWIGWHRCGRAWKFNHWLPSGLLREKLARFESAR